MQQYYLPIVGLQSKVNGICMDKTINCGQRDAISPKGQTLGPAPSEALHCLMWDRGAILVKGVSEDLQASVFI